MIRIDGSDLQGASAYFTSFDNRIVTSTRDFERLSREVERKLKILLLTKNNVVCAASHLVNPVAFKLLFNNPILFEKELIIPAFRSDKDDISELFERKKVSSDTKRNYTAFYSDHLTKTVRWTVKDGSTRFRDSFVQGLKASKSVIRNNLKQLSQKEINELIDKVQKEELLDRDTIETLIMKFDVQSKMILRNYRELLYHMSGARAVNCESTLPQENYIDYSFADMKERKTLLSEVQVFWKIYMELLLETLHRYQFPVEALDDLSFEDICSIREPILESDFIQKYNQFYQVAADSIAKDKRNDILYNSSELMRIRSSLEKQFKEIFEIQLGPYFRKKAKQEGKKLMKNTASMCLGFIPLPTVIGGTIGAVRELKSTYLNTIQVFRSLKTASDYDYYTKAKTELLQDELSRFELKKGTEMVDIVEMIQYAIASKGML